MIDVASKLIEAFNNNFLLLFLQILWVVQINWFQWLLVIIGASLSGGVLLFTFWPAVREDEKKVECILLPS